MNLETPIGDLNQDIMNYELILVATGIYGVVTITGVLTVLLFIAVLLIKRSTFKEFPFFTIVWQLTICNLIHVTTQAVCIFPLLFLDLGEDSPWQQWYDWGTRMISISDTGAIIFTFLVALNRFAVFVTKSILPAFSQQNVKYPIIIGWCLTFLSVALKFVYGPTKKFMKNQWNVKDLFVQNANVLYNALTWIDLAVPVAVLVMYILIYIVLRANRAAIDNGVRDDSNNNDYTLLMQGFVVAVSLIIFRVLANAAPQLNGRTWFKWIMNISRSIASILNHMLNPVIFFLTNKTVQNGLKELFTCKKINSAANSENTANPPVFQHRPSKFWFLKRTLEEDARREENQMVTLSTF